LKGSLNYMTLYLKWGVANFRNKSTVTSTLLEWFIQASQPPYFNTRIHSMSKQCNVLY